MKYIKSFLLLVLSLNILLAMSFSTTAMENLTAESSKQPMSAENTINIPTFITTRKTDQISSKAIQESATAIIDARFDSSQSNPNRQNDKSENKREILYSNNMYDVIKLSDNDRTELFSNYIYKPALQRAREISDSGVTLDYIIIFTNAKSIDGVISNNRGNLDSEEYWESNCEMLPTYNGYKYLYSEVCYAVNTNYVTPGSVNSSFNWGGFLSKTLKSATMMYLGSQHSAIEIGREIVSNIISANSAPLAVTFGSANGSALYTAVRGHVYTRTVFLQDKLDKFAGYAYYYYGGTDEIKVRQYMDASFPIRKRTDTTYDFEQVAGMGPEMCYTTPGFYGTREFAKELLDRYRYSNVYSVYTESLDVASIVMSILS